MRLSFGHRRAVALSTVIGLAFTSCSTPLPPVPEVAPQSVRANMLRLAEQEWAAFGNQTIFFANGEERIERVGVWEDERKGTYLVTKYWATVGKDWNGQDCDKPWSAAFISWVVRSSGVDRDLFKPSPLHADYLREIAAHPAMDGAGFALRDPGTYAPRPGDLICAPRAGARLAQFSEIPDGTPMHCDIVISNGDGKLVSIGGNVRNSVSKTVRDIGPDGKVTNVADRHWQVVVENLYPQSQQVAGSELAAQ